MARWRAAYEMRLPPQLNQFSPPYYNATGWFTKRKFDRFSQSTRLSLVQNEMIKYKYFSVSVTSSYASPKMMYLPEILQLDILKYYVSIRSHVIVCTVDLGVKRRCRNSRKIQHYNYHKLSRTAPSSRITLYQHDNFLGIQVYGASMQ